MLPFIVVALAIQGSDQKDRAAITATIKQISQATQAKDWKKLESLCTKRWSRQALNFEVYRLSEFERNLDSVRNLQLSPKILEIKINSMNKLWASCKISWTFKGSIWRDNGLHSFQHDDTEIDTFRKVDGKWLQASVRELSVKRFEDGKDVSKAVPKEMPQRPYFNRRRARGGG